MYQLPPGLKEAQEPSRGTAWRGTLTLLGRLVHGFVKLSSPESEWRLDSFKCISCAKPGASASSCKPGQAGTPCPWASVGSIPCAGEQVPWATLLDPG